MATRQCTVGSTEIFHTSVRVIDGEWFRLPMDLVWDIFCEQLYLVKHAFEIEILSFVLMANHTHMISSAPKGNFAEAQAYLNREVSRQLNRYGNRINRTFGGRYHRCLINSDQYLRNCYKYIYQNPLRAGLVNRVEDYKYSTLAGLLGKTRLQVPIERDFILFNENWVKNLEWLNRPIQGEYVEAMRQALRKSVFKLRRDPNTKQVHELETELV